MLLAPARPKTVLTATVAHTFTPSLFPFPAHSRSGLPDARTARSAPPLPRTWLCVDEKEVVETVHPSSGRVTGNSSLTPFPLKRAGASFPTTPIAPKRPDSASSSRPSRQRLLPRWLYVGWYPYLLMVVSFAVFAGGSLDFIPAAGVPRWLTPLLLAVSFSLPVGWLLLTSAAWWRALPAWLRFPGWLLAIWGYWTRASYWPTLLLEIAAFTGLEGRQLVDCLGRTPGGVVRFIPSWSASCAILSRWADAVGGWDLVAASAIRSTTTLITIYQTQGAAAVQHQIYYALPIPYLTPASFLVMHAAFHLEVHPTVELIMTGGTVFGAVWQWLSWAHMSCILGWWRWDYPPTDLGYIGSAKLCIHLSKWITLSLPPLLAVALDPFQYGLPVDLLLERALQYLEAVLVADDPFNPHLWTEPPAYPEKPAPTFSWTSPSSWWELLSRKWKK